MVARQRERQAGLWFRVDGFGRSIHFRLSPPTITSTSGLASESSRVSAWRTPLSFHLDHISKQRVSQVERMRTFPQELVDMVIDELADIERADIDRDRVAPYSLVSRAWVMRTQQYHFEWVDFRGLDELEKWRRTIVPDPAGVSRHTRHLVLAYINTLEGFEAHIRAFTRVEDLKISRCRFLLLPSVVECFTPMGSSLIQLEISQLPATSRVITSLLAALPVLETFITGCFQVTDDTGGTDLPSPIPFFGGNGSLDLHLSWDQEDPLEPPDWIPPSARFGDLEIHMTYLLHKAVLVNQ